MAKSRHFEISIPEPCGVPWESMSHVDELKRHCSSCDRVITDFSKMSDEELILMFRYSNGKLCGRFDKSQLDRPLRMLPEKTTPAGWWRTLLLLPLTLFAKPSKAQQLHETMHTKLQEPPDTVLVDQTPGDSNAVAAQSDSAQEKQPPMSVTFSDSLITFKDWPQIEYVVGIPPMDLRWDARIEPITFIWTIAPPYTICISDPVPPPSPPDPPTGPGRFFYSITDSTVFTRRKRKAGAVQLETAVASNENEQPEQKPAPVSPALSSDEVTLSWWRRKFCV